MNRSKQKALFRPWVQLRAAAILALFGFLVTSSADDTNLQKVTFLPHWIVQAQFAGFYIAKEKGIYEKYGLDVTILKGGTQYPPVECLATGKTDFASTFLSTAVEKRAEGVRLVNIAQIVQHSGLRLIARKSSGIRSVKDLDGRKVTLWKDFRTQPNALFLKYNIKPLVQPQGPYMEMFLRGAVDVASAMLYNEYHVALNTGIDEQDLTVISFDKDDLDFPEDGIYCMESFLKQRPDVCRRFVKASLEGWEYTFAHMDEALDLVMKYANTQHARTNRAHQKWMLTHICELIRAPDEVEPLGILHTNDFKRVTDELKNAGIIKNIPPMSEFHAPDCINN